MGTDFSTGQVVVLKQKGEDLNLIQGINFFTMRVQKHWTRLPREAVDDPSLPGSIQGQAGEGSEPSDLVKDSQQGWTKRSLKVPPS